LIDFERGEIVFERRHDRKAERELLTLNFDPEVAPKSQYIDTTGRPAAPVGPTGEWRRRGGE
jgi:hypothetical protein